MKWIKNREKFLAEAKIRELIFPRQAKELSNIWGEKYLDYEEVTPTTKIQQGKWKLSDEDKNKVLGKFFGCNIQAAIDIFAGLPDKLAEILAASINIDLLTDEKFKIIAKDLNIKNPSIDQIIIIFDNIFRKLSASETNSEEMVQRDESGKVVKDESDNIIKVAKKKGDPVFSNNLVNINTFIASYNVCYPDHKVDENKFKNEYISAIRNLSTLNENPNYKIDFKIYDKDVYLKIVHNPKDILNMSISKFYASCQHLYTGGYREMILANVFDPNSIPAFLVFETPIYWDNTVISEQLPISRMMIRSIETFDDSEKKKIFFDRAYPDRMRDFFSDIIEKYTENKKTVDESTAGYYVWTPDIDITDELKEPYMDKLGLKKEKLIGKNTKTLYLNKLQDWSKVRIDPNAKIKELIIETTDIPDDLTKITLEPDWVKFKLLDIKTLTNFDKIKTTSIAFDKCKLEHSIIDEIFNINPNINRIQIVSCDLSIENVNFSKYEKLEELQLIYTLDDISVLSNMVKDSKIKKLVISGDLIKSKEDKNIVSNIRKSGIKVEVKGPVI
jgi:hypothetical protein